MTLCPQDPSVTKGPWLSICTTCANRAYQLKQTLPENLKRIHDAPGVEWVLINYGSTDDLDDWVGDWLPLAGGRVTYAKLSEPRPWHASIAKNTAHRVGLGACLMNLDCDNFIDDAIDTARAYWSNGCRALHLWSGVYGDGTCGRIAIARDVFYALGGYDEAFSPMGFQDRDLILRAAQAGIPVLHAPSRPDVAIRNDKVESVRLCSWRNWKDFDNLNMLASQSNRRRGKLAANGDRSQLGANVKVVVRYGSPVGGMGTTSVSARYDGSE